MIVCYPTNKTPRRNRKSPTGVAVFPEVEGMTPIAPRVPPPHMSVNPGGRGDVYPHVLETHPLTLDFYTVNF